MSFEFYEQKYIEKLYLKFSLIVRSPPNRKDPPLVIFREYITSNARIYKNTSFSNRTRYDTDSTYKNA